MNVCMYKYMYIDWSFLIPLHDLCVQVQLVMGVGVDRHLSVIVNAPSGLIVGSVDDATGEIAFSAKETGEWELPVFIPDSVLQFTVIISLWFWAVNCA